MTWRLVHVSSATAASSASHRFDLRWSPDPPPRRESNTMTDSDACPPTAQRWILATLSLAMLMPSLDTSIANAGLPTLARAFGATFPQVQWVVLAYLLAITAAIVSAGRLGDLLGRGRLLAAGTALLASTLAAYALAMTSHRFTLLAAAAAGAALFVLVERRSAAPLVRLAMLRDPALVASLATSALVATVIMTTLVVGPFYLSRS